jgi:hypothetical protein
VKKFLAASILALGLVLASQQQASAWTKFNFSIGANINYEGGNNNFLFGLYRSGQLPGYPTDVYQGFGSQPQIQFVYPPAHGYPVPMDYAPHPVAQPMPSAAQPQKQQAQPATTQAIYNFNSQPAGYYYPTNNNYQYPTYAYPQYGYGSNYQVPSYWYGY